jgi:hypothetical protein
MMRRSASRQMPSVRVMSWDLLGMANLDNRALAIYLRHVRFWMDPESFRMLLGTNLPADLLALVANDIRNGLGR